MKRNEYERLKKRDSLAAIMLYYDVYFLIYGFTGLRYNNSHMDTIK